MVGQRRPRDAGEVDEFAFACAEGDADGRGGGAGEGGGDGHYWVGGFGLGRGEEGSVGVFCCDENFVFVEVGGGERS